jgi:protein TonB
MNKLSGFFQANSLARTLPFAIIMHAVLIFGMGFGIQSSSRLNATLLDITLVNTHSDKAPEKADIIAQVNQEASGNTNINNRPRSMMSSDSLFTPDETSPLESVKSAPRKPPVLKPMILTTKGETFKRVAKLPEQPEEKETRIEDKEISDATRADARLAAEIDQDEADYAKMPRIRYLNSSNAKSAVEAEYIDAWAKKIERIGTTNFPQEAIRLNQSGSLIVIAILNQRGAVESARIYSSSGSRILDNAALRIIKLASPYPPLPEKVRKQFDQLSITRTFLFNTGQTGSFRTQ